MHIKYSSVLYLIIQKFSKEIFNSFKINIINYPTLSSLAFAIYRTVFIKDFKIPKITGELYNFIKKGFTGGAVDVYKPYGKNIYRYDVNSLYPFIMKNFPMPVNKPIFMEGDLSEFNLNQFAFMEVEVQAPKNLNIPFLQTRIINKKGSQITVSPLGNWTGIYTSNEIKKAMELGYNFKFLRAVIFETENIFNDFVDYFYNIKKNSDKNTSEYTISKFILNSLSGRFALEPYLEKHIITDNSNLLDLATKFSINNVIKLGKDKILVSYILDKDNYNKFNNSNISIPISANITANARIWMYQFKNEDLFYSDTDSIDTSRLLNPKFIGLELGKMKLEYIFKEAIYLAPKAYGAKYSNFELIKIKGSKNLVSFEDLKTLLTKNNKLEINQEKWIKDISKGNIAIHKDIYTLMVTDNKRKLIYNNNQFIDTKPLILKNGKLLD